MHATDITATITRPADQFGSDWNWAQAAMEAWVNAAHTAGLTIEAEDHGDYGDSIAGRVQVGGTVYALEVGRGGDPDEVRAIPTGRTDDATARTAALDGVRCAATGVFDDLGHLIGVIVRVAMPPTGRVLHLADAHDWDHDWDDDTEAGYYPISLGAFEDPASALAEIEARARLVQAPDTLDPRDRFRGRLRERGLIPPNVVDEL